MRLGGTRRRRIPISETMPTETFAEIAETHSPSGTKCRKIETARITMTTRNAPPNSVLMKTS